MRVKELEARITNVLKVDKFDFDIAQNGIQVLANPNQQIKHIATAVDATKDVIQKACEIAADCLIVHHGLIWGESILNPMDSKKVDLEDHDCSLLAYHLPLDSNIDIGNNAILAALFGLEKIQPFGKLPNDRFIGVKGVFNSEALDRYRKTPLSGRINHCLSNNDIILDKDGTCKVAIVSGAGGDYFREAIRHRIDLFITGECRYQDAIAIKNGMKMKVDFIGHHASETQGVKALGEMLAETFFIKHTFIDSPIFY